MEKKFDKLLNDKCSWSYKTQKVRSNKITNKEDSTIHLESTVMTIEISEKTPDKENNKKPAKNPENMGNKSWLRDEQTKTNRAKNYKRKSMTNVKKTYSPLKRVFNNNRGKTFTKKTMLKNSKSIPSQKLLLNSDRVLRNRSLQLKDEINAMSSSSDEEVLQARNPAHDKVIYNENDSDSCNISYREIVSDEEILENGGITKKTSPIIIQATPYINQNNANNTNQNSEGKESTETNKSLENRSDKYQSLPENSKKIESVSADSLSVEPNTPKSDSEEILKTNNYDESNVNVKDKESFDNNCNEKDSLLYCPENTADDLIIQDLKESETSDENIISNFLDGSFDVNTYNIKERYFDYNSVENSEETNLNSKMSEKNDQLEDEITSPELFTDDIYEMNIFKRRELNHSGCKSTKYKQSDLVENPSIESQAFPTQKRKIIKKEKTKNVNKKRKVQSSQDDSESEEKLQKKANMRKNKVKNATKDTFIECINLDSTGDEGTIYRHTRNSSLLASRRIKEIGKIESISVINDSDIYSVHDESLSATLSDNIKRNLDEITKKYLKDDNMWNESMDVVEYNRKTKKCGLVDKDKKGSARNKKKFQENKFEEDSDEQLLRKNTSRNKGLASNLHWSDDQYKSSKNPIHVTGSKNKYKKNNKLKTDNEEHLLRKNTDKTDKNEKLAILNTSDDEENYSLRRRKYSARSKIKFQENMSKVDNNEHVARKNKNSMNKELTSNLIFFNDESARNKKYLTRSKSQKKLKASNDDYYLKKNNKNIKNNESTLNINLSDEEDYRFKGFNENLHLESRKKGRIENKNLSNIENETMKNIGTLNKNILTNNIKGNKCESITRGKQKTWDDLENELLKELDNEMTFTDTRNVSIILRQEKLVRKKDASNNKNLLTVSNKSMTQRISKSLKDGTYMQYEVQNTQSEYLESTATATNPIGKEIIPTNSENMTVLQKAIAAMEKCTAEFMKQKEVNIVKNSWMGSNLMVGENSDSVSNYLEFDNNNVLLEENEPCTSNKMVPYRKNLRSSKKCVNNKNKTPKVSNCYSLSKKDRVENFDAKHSVNKAHQNNSVDNAEKNEQNTESHSLVLLQEVNPWDGLIKELNLEQSDKNDSSKLYNKSEKKEIHKMVLNSYNKSFNGSRAISETDNIEKEIDNDNKLSELESLNHNTPEDCTSLKEDILNNEINLLTNSKELKKNYSNDELAHDDIESGTNQTTIEKAKSIRNDGKNTLKRSKEKKKENTVLLKGKKSPILKFKLKKDGSLKLKKHSSESSSVTSSSEYSTKFKATSKDQRIELHTRNNTNNAREKYTNYLKKLYKLDSVVEGDQTVAPNVEQSTVVTSGENDLVADKTKEELQMPKLMAQKDDDVFSVSSSESDDSKKGRSGSGLFCEMFDE